MSRQTVLRDIVNRRDPVVRAKCLVMSRPLPLFATRNDWLSCLAPAKTERPLAFTLSGIFDEPATSTLFGVASIPDFGVAEHGNAILEPCYLVHDVGTQIRVRDVPQRRGGVRYAVDQRINHGTVGLKPGGKSDGNVVIAGQLGNASDDQIGSELLEYLTRHIKTHFSHIKSYWVGPEAETILDGGGKLAVSRHADSLYDLAR